MSHLIAVQLDVLGGLLAELRALGVELGEDQRLSAATGASLERALPGPVGEAAAQAGGAWSGALATLVARTLAVAATLEAALDAYRAADLGLAGGIAGGGGAGGRSGGAGTRAVPR